MKRRRIVGTPAVLTAAIITVFCLFTVSCSMSGAEIAESASRQDLETTEGQTGSYEDSERSGAKESGYERVRRRLSFSGGPFDLQDVNEITGEEAGEMEPRWKGYYNDSRERLDMEWEDGTRLIFLRVSVEPYHYEMVMEKEYRSWQLVEIDGEIDGKGFEENYLKREGSPEYDYYYPETATRLLTEAEIKNMRQTELSLARNEIFARHGREYRDPLWGALFSRKSWYYNQSSFEKRLFAEQGYGLFNSFERDNLEAIVREEENRGYRIKAGEEAVRLTEIMDDSWLDLDGNGTKECVCLRDILNNGPANTGAYELEIYYGNPTERRNQIKTSIIMREMPDVRPCIYTAVPDGKTTLIFFCTEENAEEPAMDVIQYVENEIEPVGRIAGDQVEMVDGRLYATMTPEQFPFLDKTIRVYCTVR